VNFPWRCPYCQHNATIGNSNFFSCENRTDKAQKFGPLVIRSEIVICPNADCQQISFNTSLWDAEFPSSNPHLTGYDHSGTIKHAEWQLVPASRARVFPDYVPAPILNDYREACTIEALSPKASATLARRCLQGIIRGFYKVSKSRLIDEIKAIESQVEPKVYAAIDALRELGNIGAHPEKDIDVIIDVEPDEAAALINLVELFIEETYVADFERQKRLDKITTAAAEKKSLKRA